MKKMLFIIALGFLFTASISCATQVICPQTITCNYDEGTCDISRDWFYQNPMLIQREDGLEKFPDGQTISLTSIVVGKILDDPILGYKFLPDKTGYYFSCGYEFGKYKNAFIISKQVKSIIGQNWVKSGFGKITATCSDVKNPGECAGEN